MSKYQGEGILKVFLSSTFRDLREMRGQLLDRLVSALKGAAMEIFVPSGDTSQRTALKELKESNTVIFLISPNKGTDIPECELKGQCKADCEMKNGEEKISYTWCEFRFALAENKPHSTYIIDEGWENISRDGDSKLWKFRDEIEEKEFCPRIRKDNTGVEIVINNLVSNIIKWYSEGRINFNKFCGRRSLLKELFNEMNKSVEVTGVGGIGKTTLCEVALLIHKLLGKKIVYVGLGEAYASGTGYEYTSQKLPSHRFPELTIDDIIDTLGLGELKKEDNGKKIEAIIQFLGSDGAILFIDNFRENETLKKLIGRANTLNRGCILISSKKELGIAFYRLPLGSIEEGERGKLVQIIASRVGKEVGDKEAKRIEEIAEGHPIATYLLISNLGRVNIKKLERFKERLDFSRNDDVKEYMNRVIKSGISPEAYNLLKDLSVIEEEIDRDIIYESYSAVYSLKKEKFLELRDAYLIEGRGDNFVWLYNQIKEAVFEDIPERHKLAAEYYRIKLAKYHKIDDEIEMLYHNTKINYTNEIFKRFTEIAESIKEEDPTLRLLPKLGEEVKKYVEGKDKAGVCLELGKIYSNISNYKDKAENCKRAIKAYEGALEIFNSHDFPMEHAITQNGLGTVYEALAEVEDKTENCKRALSILKEALKIHTLDKYPVQYATTQNSIGNAYKILSEVEDRAENCKRAIKAYEEALRIRTLEKFPMEHAITQNGLGTAYGTLATVEDRAENCKLAIDAFKDALRIHTLEKYPMGYAMTQNNLGSTYWALAMVEDRAENCKLAIDAFKEALRIYTLDKYPMQYATAQYSLGNAYRTLAEVEDKIKNCKSAIDAFKEALRIYTLDRYPLQYATTQNSIGSAFDTLATVEDRAENCKLAIDAFNEALRIRTLDKYPLDYAMTQNNLGIVYRILAEVENRAENCKRAIDAFKEALRVYTLETYPMDYAMIQNGLGTAYGALAMDEDMAENCKRSIGAFNEALRIYTLDRYPLQYATTQNSLGNTYRIFAGVENIANNSKKAIDAFNEALRVHTLNRYPIQYAMAQNGLGTAYQSLAIVEDTTNNIKKSIDAFKEAQNVFTLEKSPINYALIQNNLGAAYATLAVVEDMAENCKMSIDAFKEALRIYTLGKYPLNYAMSQNGLGFAYTILAGIESRAENFKLAINAFKEALGVYTMETYPINYARIQTGLGAAYATLAMVEDKAENCKKAIKSFKEAIRVFTENKFLELCEQVKAQLLMVTKLCS
nr:DUF4062 domain-containing protein [Candidatus Freyarchaeota archaeon]